MFYDSIGMDFNDDVVQNQAIGGSEFVLWQLAQELGRRGFKVLVQLTRHQGIQNVYGNVTYRYGLIKGPLETTHLIHHRYSDLKYEDKVNWKTRSFLCSDLWGPHYAALGHLVVPGNVVCVSIWQSSQFPSNWSVKIIANPLPSHVYESTEIRRDPRVFVYASAALKGLASTLTTWQKIRSIYPELQDSRLRVLNPGYDDASALCLPEYEGVEFVGSVPFHQVTMEFRSAAGLFFVNDYPETFCLTAALAEATGARVHCWIRNGGAVSETVNSSLVTTSEESFISNFKELYKNTSNSGIASPKKYDVTTIVDRWLTHFSNLPRKSNLPVKNSKSLDKKISKLKVKISSTNSHSQVQLNKAIALHQNGQLADAESIYNEMLRSSPNNFDALHLSGVIAAQRNDHQSAIKLITNAIKINSGDARSHYNLGFSYQKLKLFESALTNYKNAILLDPTYSVAFSNLAAVFKELHLLSNALISYNHALDLNPLSAEDYSNRSVVLTALRRADEAISDCQQAIRIRPNFSKAYYNLGLALIDVEKLEEAVTAFATALSLQPGYEYLISLQHTQMKLCDWHLFHTNLQKLIQYIDGQQNFSSAFPILSLTDSLSIQRKSAEIWNIDKNPANLSLGPILKRARGGKIRLGYFSADFHNHATAYLMAELFERHDKDKFDLIAFSFGPDTKDEMQVRVAKAFDQFIDVKGMSDLEVAQFSRELGVDIAIDLKGLTKDSRLRIFSFKAAPIQVSYLGYPGTLGVDYFDYLIADKTLIPEASVQHYSEKIVYLPNSYQVNDRHRVIASTHFTKQEFGLPQDVFVFCCFNNNYKITPDIFDSWVRILKAVDSSVLWLLQDNSTAAINLQKEAAIRGLDPARLVFAKRTASPEHLARHKFADLFLDTLPYNAHTTASDALWTGLPVLTCMGESFASRVAASLLKAIGLPELVTETLDDYEALAISLATTPAKLKGIKEKLGRNRLTTPLFDTALFAIHIEEAYSQMYERYQDNLPPDHIEILN
jgi:tetratricopeptide (TPR) repeat protein